LGLGPDEVGQSGMKVFHLWNDVTYKKSETKKKSFFHCELQDLPSLLSI